MSLKIWSVAGTRTQILCAQRHVPENALEMPALREPNEVCQDNGDGTGTWIVSTDLVADIAEETAKEEERNTGYLSNLTMGQAEAWINANVTNLASAKTALKRIVKLILART